MIDLEPKGNVIDMEQARRESWIRKIIQMRELGEVAVFGSIGPQEAIIIQFPTPEGGQSS